MTEELAFLRSIATNPYDSAPRAVYADWLDEQGRNEEAAEIRGRSMATAPRVGGNSITVRELLGVLYQFPLDAVVLYQACSDWSELQADEVKLVRAEDQKIIWREQNGYTDYDPRWFASEEELRQLWQSEAYRTSRGLYGDTPFGWHLTQNKYFGERPNFVTVVTFPGN